VYYSSGQGQWLFLDVVEDGQCSHRQQLFSRRHRPQRQHEPTGHSARNTTEYRQQALGERPGRRGYVDRRKKETLANNNKTAFKKARTCTQLRSLMFDPTLKRLQVARFQQRLALGRSVEPFLLQVRSWFSFRHIPPHSAQLLRRHLSSGYSLWRRSRLTTRLTPRCSLLSLPRLQPPLSLS